MNSKKKKMKNTIVIVLALGHAVAFAQLPAYKNPLLPVEAGETRTVIFSVTADKLAAIAWT